MLIDTTVVSNQIVNGKFISTRQHT